MTEPWDSPSSDVTRVVEDGDYGVPVSSEIAERLLGPKHNGEKLDGLIWEVYVLGDKFNNPKFIKDNTVKARRPIPVVRAKEFFASLTKTSKEGMWVFAGVLNGWEGLNLLELLKLETFGKNKAKSEKKFIDQWSIKGDQRETNVVWDSWNDSDVNPTYTGNHGEYIKATLRSPPHFQNGFSQDNPGNIWYYAQFRNSERKFAHGTRVLEAIESEYHENMPVAVSCHHVVHRYVRKVETEQDKHIYHSAVFVEWNHGKYGTIFELAFKYGISGYSGRSNWIDTSAQPGLFKAMPAAIKTPWKEDLGEVRIIDTAYKNKKEFLDFLMSHNENVKDDMKFIDPKIDLSADIQDRDLTFLRIAQGCVNYVLKDHRYSAVLQADEHRSCQTFSADLYSFLTNDDKVMPFSPFLKDIYIRKAELFSGMD